MDKNDLARALRWAKGQFSLDPQPDQDIVSPETAGDVALGFVPGVGQAMALRDMERARRAEDPVAGGLAAASLLPWGRLGGAVKNKIIAGSNARHAPLAEMKAGEDALSQGMHPDKVWNTMGVYAGPENHAPMKWEIPDQGARLAQTPSGMPYEGKLGELLKHPEFFKNYPEAHDWKVTSRLGPDETGSGSFLSTGDSGFPKLDVSGKDQKELMQTLLHEVQHGVQNLEGFDPGSNAKAVAQKLIDNKEFLTLPPMQEVVEALRRGKDSYARNMGENEASMVERRYLQSRDFNKKRPPEWDMRTHPSRQQSWEDSIK